MARNPQAPDPNFAEFATLLDRLLRIGMRPSATNRRPWTNAEFASGIAGRELEATSLAPNSVGNWRRGIALPHPRAIEQILTQLFGPPRPDGGPTERQKIREAWNRADAARTARYRQALSESEEPVGQAVRIAGERLAIHRAPAENDIAAAADPEVQAEHPPLITRARRLAELVARRHNQLSDGWGDLLLAAQEFLAAIDCPTSDLPQRLVPAYQACIDLASLYDQDERYSRVPEPGEAPLPADLRRQLGGTVTFAAQLLHAFPYVQHKDAKLRRFLRAEDLPAARAFTEGVQRHDLLSPEDQDLITDIDAVAERAGTQAQKAQEQLVGTVNNLFLAGTAALLEPTSAPLLVQRVRDLFRDVEAALDVITSVMPPDVRAALRHGMDVVADDAAPGPSPPPPPLFITPLTWWRDRIEGLAEDVCPEMVTLPAGRFVMGSPEGEEGGQDNERPQREVEVPLFALGRCAVTFGQWDAAIAAGARLRRPGDQDWGRGDRPVINVSWEDAQAYCAWLNERLGLRVGGYRLPTEAEWEYACRAGTTTPFWFGETISTAQANYDGNYVYGRGRKGEFRGRTVPVGTLPANGWGLHEMHGNVFEWVQDVYRDSYEGAPLDGSVAVTVTEKGSWIGKLLGRNSKESRELARVVRGGAWDGIPLNLRSAFRIWFEPGFRSRFTGFRVARTPGG